MHSCKQLANSCQLIEHLRQWSPAFAPRIIVFNDYALFDLQIFHFLLLLFGPRGDLPSYENA